MIIGVQTKKEYHNSVDGIEKYGTNGDIDTGSPEEVWSVGGIYSFPTTSESIEVLSSDAADTAAGTGARTVTVIGINNATELREISETVTLNGVTPVALTKTFYRIYRANVITAGTGEVNAGTITIRVASAGATRAEIPIGKSSTLMAIFTIPAVVSDSNGNDTTVSYGILNDVWMSMGVASPAGSIVTGELYFRYNGTRVLKHEWYLRTGGTTEIEKIFKQPKKALPGTDIYVRGTVTTSNTGVASGFSVEYIT